MRVGSRKLQRKIGDGIGPLFDLQREFRGDGETFRRVHNKEKTGLFGLRFFEGFAQVRINHDVADLEYAVILLSGRDRFGALNHADGAQPQGGFVRIGDFDQRTFDAGFTAGRIVRDGFDFIQARRQFGFAVKQDLSVAGRVQLVQWSGQGVLPAEFGDDLFGLVLDQRQDREVCAEGFLFVVFRKGKSIGWNGCFHHGPKFAPRFREAEALHSDGKCVRQVRIVQRGQRGGFVKQHRHVSRGVDGEIAFASLHFPIVVFGFDHHEARVAFVLQRWRIGFISG